MLTFTFFFDISTFPEDVYVKNTITERLKEEENEKGSDFLGCDKKVRIGCCLIE